MKNKILNPTAMSAIGLLLGVISRLLDIYTENLGNIFSQMAIWILFGTLIAIYSDTKKKAMANVFTFCIGMLITYYAVAAITKGVYSAPYIIGWTVFALLCPVFAFFAWMTKEQGLYPKLIGCGIVVCSILTSILLFDRLRIYDFVIDGVLIYFLFIKKVDRNSSKP